jgi:hypothetical protein
MAAVATLQRSGEGMTGGSSVRELAAEAVPEEKTPGGGTPGSPKRAIEELEYPIKSPLLARTASDDR